MSDISTAVDVAMDATTPASASTTLPTSPRAPNFTGSNPAVLYQLMISQLKADGFEAIASTLAEEAQIRTSVLPSTKLQTLVKVALDIQKHSQDDVSHRDEHQTKELDLEGGPTTEEVKDVNYELVYTRAETGTPKTARFSTDGSLLASGCEDGTVQVFHIGSALASQDISGNDTQPMAHNISAHSMAVNDLCFHPNNSVLVTCGKDKLIKCFDISRVYARNSFKDIQDGQNVRSIDLHPTGDFLLAGTDHHDIRLFDMATFQCFSTPNPSEAHTAPINQVRYANDARIYASCCKAGVVKIWDGTTNRCIKELSDHHGGYSVSSVQFSRNQRYLLTTGRDSICRLWDLRQGLKLTYKGAVQEKYRFQAVFSHDEQLVFSPHETTASVPFWNALTGEAVGSLSGHAANVRAIAHSKVDAIAATCCNDKRVRLWKQTGSETS